MKYRTREQMEDILDSARNENFVEAANLCEEYGVYVKDLCDHVKEKYNEGYYPEDSYWIEEMENVAYIMVDATKIRAEKTLLEEFKNSWETIDD